MHFTTAPGNVNGLFVDGIPGVQASTLCVSADTNTWMNELVNVATYGGIALDPTNDGQVLAAILRISGASTSGFVKAGGIAGTGTNALSMGWDGTTSKMLLQVDVTVLGNIAVESWVTSNYLKLSGGAVTGALNVSGNMTAGSIISTGAMSCDGNFGANGQISTLGVVTAVGNIISSGIFSSNDGMQTSGPILIGAAVVTDPVGSGVSGIALSPAGTIISNTATGWEQASGNNVYQYFFDQNKNVIGSITNNGTSTAFNTSSDYRLKENLTPLTGAMARINSVPVYRGNFLSNPDATVDMFLAHEAAIGVPEAVHGAKDADVTVADVVLSAAGKVLSTGIAQADFNPKVYPAGCTWAASAVTPVFQQIDQGKLVPVLWAGAQEHDVRLDAHDATIASMQATITALQAAVTALQPAPAPTPVAGA